MDRIRFDRRQIRGVRSVCDASEERRVGQRVAATAEEVHVYETHARPRVDDAKRDLPGGRRRRVVLNDPDRPGRRLTGPREPGVDERVVEVLGEGEGRVGDGLGRNRGVDTAQEHLDLPRSRFDPLVVHGVRPVVGIEQTGDRHDVDDAHVLLHRVRHGVDEVDPRRRGHRNVGHGVRVTAARRQRQRAHHTRPERCHRTLERKEVKSVHCPWPGPPSPPVSIKGRLSPNKWRVAMIVARPAATVDTSRIVRFFENRRSWGTAT